MTTKEYEELIQFAKNIDPVNYLDIVHDYILDGGTLKGHKFKYKTSAIHDYTTLQGTTNTCTICNEIKPVACFALVQTAGLKYTANQCIDCINKNRRERYKNDPEFRKKVDSFNQAWKEKNLEKVKAYNKAYYGEWIKDNKEYRRNYNKKWRQENPDKVRQQYDRNNEYNKKYQQRKKLLQQSVGIE